MHTVLQCDRVLVIDQGQVFTLTLSNTLLYDVVINVYYIRIFK